MKRRLILTSFPVLLIIGIYFLGPVPAKPKWNAVMPEVPQTAGALENYVTTLEAQHKLKPDNEARIIWADSNKQKTPYSIVYIHGFSASPMEGNPVHLRIAKEFGCNLFLARMADHGIDTTDQLIYFTPDRWWKSSLEALAIGKALGEKVIVMSTSTGGTMALILAAEYPNDVYALINFSPNIAINNPLAFMGNNPWGLQIARLVSGGNYQVSKDSLKTREYWYSRYRCEALPQLQELLEDKMTPATFHKIKQPSLTLYYYKNAKEQDQTVKVSAMLEMNKELGTPDSLKKAVAIPNAGEHPIASSLRSKDVESVINETAKFMKKIIK